MPLYGTTLVLKAQGVSAICSGDRTALQISDVPSYKSVTRPETLATVATSSEGSTGFDTCTRKPARRARVRSSERAKAVSAIAGTLPPRSGAERAHAPEQFEPVGVGHADVADEHVRSLRLDEHEGLFHGSRP